ncbi:carbohydrate ABC transporter permease [Demequina rhizosphaerae]|uniref:carbohydrate ABC transporter permease n=1 Tax=Demequina rhizosphaerae TaxID=1638985 RepID=UPI00078666AB|nr:carbohydrate ABC transporter permease [Demequina rhizosphaerae]
MSTPIPPRTEVDADLGGVQPTEEPKAKRVKKRLTSRGATAAAIVIAILWTIPTFGLAISSFRPEREVKTTGWWTIFENWGWTLDNYYTILFESGASSASLGSYFINSFVIAIPGTIFPLVLALMAAYAFAWIPFKGASWLFVMVFALQIVPLQMALIPLLRIFNYDWIDISGTFAAVWVAHTIFALPLAIFLLHNFISEIPRDVMEAAKVDGSSHTQTFTRIVLPLSVPAIASLAIFQFLWVWNDLLVALVFSGGTVRTAPLTQRLAEFAGDRGSDWQLLTAAAFVSIIVPLIVFFSLQRYFVRGLLAGSTKG